MAHGSAPEQVVAAQNGLVSLSDQARCEEVLAQLTARQVEVLLVFTTGRKPQEVTEGLCISLKTIDTNR